MKFGILLVGLWVVGEILVIEFEFICDYIECMLCVFGYDVKIEGNCILL